MESNKDISQNVTPAMGWPSKFELLPPRLSPLELAGRRVARVLHFVFDHHYRPQGADEMLLAEDQLEVGGNGTQPEH